MISDWDSSQTKRLILCPKVGWSLRCQHGPRQESWSCELECPCHYMDMKLDPNHAKQTTPDLGSTLQLCLLIFVLLKISSVSLILT